MAHIQTQAEWEEEMSQKVLLFVRNELYMDLRFFDIALGALKPKADDRLSAFATDGSYLYYSGEQLLRVFQNNAAYLNRAYLHTVLHCIFSHLWICGKREAGLWNLACDIAVEYSIDRMDKPSTRRILSWQRQQMYARFQKEDTGISAAIIYRILKEKEAEELRLLQKEFYTDDHSFWPKQEEDRAKQEMAVQNKKRWDKIARQSKMEQKQRGNETKEGEEILAAQLAAEKSKRSYRDFLQKFSVLREELRCDPDEFDLNYYTYGLQIYGNMPLMEPVETKESRKIREFVIAIDTSYSTSGDLIKGFLRETADILHQSDSFFGDSRIRILQCDNQVRMDREVCTAQEMKQLLEQFEVAGGGGTDFRPVFSHINQLLEQGELRNLCGLLYFTDGLGVYPGKRPEYKTAFLFLEDYDETAVPSWAMRLKLEPEEFTG